MQQREELHPGGQAREELIEAGEGRIGVRGTAECLEQGGYQLGEDLARPLAARRAIPSVMPAAYRRSRGRRVGKAEAAQRRQRLWIVVDAGEDEIARPGETRRLLEELGVVFLDLHQVLPQLAGERGSVRIAEEDRQPADAFLVGGVRIG